MEFRLLGPFEAEHDGQIMDVGRRRERALLGILLLLAFDTPVSAERLIHLLWEGKAPPAASGSLRVHMSRLRRVLDSSGTDRLGFQLVTRKDGYLVRADSGSVDVHQFRELIEAARVADSGRRAKLLRQALALWRGPLLAGTVSPWVREQLGEAQLTELRLAAIEQLIDAELAARRDAKVIPELFALTAEHPYRERFTGQLMLALYRSGRQSEALRVYERLRDQIASELGVDTGPQLRELHTAILRHDPELVTSAPNVTPSQLPPCPAGFTGRAAELTAISAALAGDGIALPICAISGVGGIGKTWLALYWAHHHRERFPDGQLFMDMRGFDPSMQPMTTEAVMHGFLEALGVAPKKIPVDPAAQIGMYRSLMADRRMLIVLDNARDTAQVVDLLPGSAACAVVVTSRDRLTALVNRHGAVPLLLDVLDRAQARDLLMSRLGEQQVATQSEAVASLVAGCGGLPLALGMVASRAATHPELRLATIAAEVRDADTRLGALDGREALASLRGVLASSYEALTPQQAELFGLLGMAPGPDISLDAAAALAGMTTTGAAAALRGLERWYLVQQHVPGRWRMHDLVHLYASERAAQDQPLDDRRWALRRIVDFYLHAACAADKLLSPHRPSIALEEPMFLVQPHVFADASTARSWLDVEHVCLVAAQQLAYEQGWYEPVWQLAWALYTHHHRRRRHHVQLEMWRVALKAAVRARDGLAQIQSHRFLGRTCIQTGRHAEAAEHLEQAWKLAEQFGDALMQAHCQLALSTGSDLCGDYQRALEHAVKALEIYRRFDDPALRAVALNSAGSYAARLGQYEQAETWLREALELHSTFHDESYYAYALSSMGYLVYQQGQRASALGYYEQALILHREVEDAYAEAETLDDLGRIHSSLGDDAGARQAWQQAVRLFREQRRSEDADRVLRRLFGMHRGDGSSPECRSSKVND